MGLDRARDGGLDEGTKIRRFLEGQKLGGERRRPIAERRGGSAQAVAESLSACERR